ncbi:MAG: LON peptidase substrate-binding domain-containing protein [Bacteroidales bacterium]|nr:LON peptidase substrate-binding domain-containing protein [Bacteroidales bacterium]
MSITILPGEKQKLHVFEPRYQQLMRDIRDADWYFGIPFTKADHLYKYGCYVKIIKTTSYNPETGEMDIIVEGCKTFKLNRYLPYHGNRLYDSGLVEWLDDGYAKSCEDLLKEFQSYFDELKAKFKPFKNTSKMTNIWNIVKFLPLTEDEKIRFVSLEEPEKRRIFLKNKIKILREVNKKALQLNENLYYN